MFFARAATAALCILASGQSVRNIDIHLQGWAARPPVFPRRSTVVSPPFHPKADESGVAVAGGSSDSVVTECQGRLAKNILGARERFEAAHLRQMTTGTADFGFHPIPARRSRWFITKICSSLLRLLMPVCRLEFLQLASFRHGWFGGATNGDDCATWIGRVKW